MKINRRIIYWVCVFLVLGVTFYIAFIRPGYRIKIQIVKKTVQIAQIEKDIPVVVETVSTNSIERTIETTGWVKANKIVNIASKVPGRVETLSVVSEQGAIVEIEEGVEVKKGQKLAVIDHDIYLAQLAATEASVKAAEVELADALREKNRIVSLYESGSATAQSKDKAITAAEVAAAKLSSAKSNLELAEINLRESTIISPTDGVVTKKYIDPGNLIKAGDQIATVADMKTVKIVVAIAERYSQEVHVGTPVRIKSDALPERVFEAEVYSIYPALDEQTNTIQVEIRLKNDELLLKPGMFASITMVTERKDDVVVISRDVVLGGKVNPYYVYIINNDTAHKTIVQVGVKQADRYEIADGLKPGQTLVVNGMNYLEDGTKVHIVQLEDVK